MSTKESWKPGATLNDGTVSIAVIARHATAVWLCLFDGEDHETARVPLTVRRGDVWHCSVAGVSAGDRYGLRAEGPWAPEQGHRFDATKLLVDPYAAQLDRPFVWHRDLAASGVDTARLVPKAIVQAALPAYGGPAWTANPARDLIYEVPVKAFTARHPAIPQEQRGTVAALAHPAIIAHLTALGVGVVELMPLMAAIDERHLAEQGLRNAWGYNPITFFAPDPRLAPGGMAEIAATVAALHAAGIGVVLDVVFNHTGESDAGGPTLSLRGIDNALYFAHEANGQLVNHSGCGNTLALDRAPVVALAMDAMRHWVRVTGIDGFRFDLAPVMGRTAAGFSPHAPLLAAIAQDPVLKNSLLIAEPWDIGPGGYQLGAFGAPWLEWNDHYRDDVRRYWRGDAGAAGGLATRLAGSADVFAGQHRPPSASVNSVAAHDGFALADVVAYAGKHNQANGEGNRDGTGANWSWNNGIEGATGDPVINAARRRDVRALLATLMLSRGTPMLTAGDEFGRTQGGNNNAYAQDNATTWLDWENADTELAAFAGGLVRLRALHGFATDRHLSGRIAASAAFADAVWLQSEGLPLAAADWSSADVFALQLHQDDRRLSLWFNRSAHEQSVRLPAAGAGLAWQRICDSAAASLMTHPVDEPATMLAARGVTVFIEIASAPVRRSSTADDGTLARLAGAYGIQADWWEVDGTHHTVSAGTQRALLAAMRVPYATASDARAALAERAQAHSQRRLPLTVLGTSHAPTLVTKRALASHGFRRDALVLTLAGGEQRRVMAGPSDLSGIGGANDAAILTATLALGTLPAGVHTLHFEQAPGTASRLIISPGAVHSVPAATRLFGLTSHLYALRHTGDAGIGDFRTLGRFAKASAALGGAFAGINPLHHLFPTDRERASPYQSSDRHRLDPIYLDLTALAAAMPGGEGTARLSAAGAALAGLAQARTVDYTGVWQLKRHVLEGFWRDFSKPGHAAAETAELAQFVAGGGDRLARHAQFEVLANQAGNVDRTALSSLEPIWPQPDEADALGFRCWLQWQCERQFAAAAATAKAASLTYGLYRDMALGTAFDSGEVWAEPQLFAEGVSLGAPPDPFSRAGQVWNLAPYDPHALEQAGYEPMQALLAANMRHAGLLRIDHILGFMRQFWVPRGAEGRDGAYVQQPLDALLALTAIESRKAQCAVIGEDLGTVPDGLRGAMSAAGILSYLVLWFEREGAGFRSPATYPALAAACLSSHDLPTFRGWQKGLDIALDAELGRVTSEQRHRAEDARVNEARALAQTVAAMVPEHAGSDPLVAVHAAVSASPALLLLVQVDDLTGETEPLNLPGTDRERPNWRRRLSVSVDDLAALPDAQAVTAPLRTSRPRG